MTDIIEFESRTHIQIKLEEHENIPDNYIQLVEQKRLEQKKEMIDFLRDLIRQASVSKEDSYDRAMTVI